MRDVFKLVALANSWASPVTLSKDAGKDKLSGTISQLRWRAPLDEAGERALATAQPEHRVPGQHRALEQFDTHPLSGERVDRYQMRRLVHRQPQKSAYRQRVAGAPSDPASESIPSK